MSSDLSATQQPTSCARHQQILDELAEIGADIARMIHNQVKHQAEAPSPADAQVASPSASPASAQAQVQFPDPILAFERITRAVRRTILLSSKLEQLSFRPPTQDPQSHRIATRKRILREVEDAIQHNAEPADRSDLRAELHDRLDSPDLEDDIDERPLDDIITDICRDLRVAGPYSSNWKRRTPPDVESLRQKAAAVPPAWTKPPPQVRPKPQPRRQTKPTLAPNHDDPASLMAEFARIKHNTG